MAFNGTGTFLRIYNWVTDKVNSIPITASRFDGELDGMATGLSNCITKDGQTTITANIPFNSNKITGLGNGTARTDVINVGQVQDNQFQYLGTTGGAADAYTLSPSPTITAYATTQQITAKISATNLTTTPYLQVSAIANPATTAVIKKLSATKTEIAVEASDLLINGIYHFQRNSANDAWIILNPEKAFYNGANLSAATTAIKGAVFFSNPIIIANNATDSNNDIDFPSGNFQFSDGSGQAYLPSLLTKRLDASWVAGTNQGGLFSGTKAINTWYYCFAIYNPTTLAVDVGFDISSVGANIPAGFTKSRYIHAIRTNVSGNIIQGYWFANGRFKYSSNITETPSATFLTTDSTFNILVPPIKVQPILHWFWQGNAGSAITQKLTFTSNLTGEYSCQAITSGGGVGFLHYFDSVVNNMIINDSIIKYKAATAVAGLQTNCYNMGYIDLTL